MLCIDVVQIQEIKGLFHTNQEDTVGTSVYVDVLQKNNQHTDTHKKLFEINFLSECNQNLSVDVIT